MAKFLNNSKILKKDIFRMSSPKISRLSFVRLDKNERYNSHKSIIFNKLKNKISNDLITSYPEFNKAYELLSKTLKVRKSNLLFTAGSDQALRSTFELYYKKNKKVITISPTFAMVDIYCKIFNTKQIKIGFDEKLNLKIDDLISSINKQVCLIVIANPNSPTGTIISEKNIDIIIKKANKYGAKVLIDEAYFEFSKYNCIKKISKYKNLVIIRTFSKIYGLAGLRCGYVVSNYKIIKEYTAIKPMYEINSIAVKAIETILSNKRIIKSYLNELKISEKAASDFCKENKYKFIKCHANFFHVSFNNNPLKIQNFLKKNMFLIKGGPGTKEYSEYVRISLANKNTILKTLNKIKSFLSKKR